jgi:hypothetical protein
MYTDCFATHNWIPAVAGMTWLKSIFSGKMPLKLNSFNIHQALPSSPSSTSFSTLLNQTYHITQTNLPLQK